MELYLVIKKNRIMSFEEYWNSSASHLPCFLLREVDTGKTQPRAQSQGHNDSMASKGQYCPRQKLPAF